ncbi:MAG TPA: ornithine cyclodeaminase family protein [Candidatus Limnocylindrales bacterium]|nr:ornithine cyclodeaminase family protein [Candidatus Limnocylindrales bacterium]
MVLFLRETDIHQLLTMEDTLPIVEEVFRQQGLGTAINRPRFRVRLPEGVLHIMPAATPVFKSLGFKAYTTFRGGARFLFFLYHSDTGELLAIMEANRLGQMRTGAATGIATKYMARPEARTVGIFGAGWQAQTQLLAVCAVRKIQTVKVYSRTPETRRTFSQEMASRLKVNVQPVDSPEEVVRGSDIIITITSAREPVFKGEWLEPGVHLNVAGSNSAIRREVDDETIRRSDFIVVDSKEDGMIESGDLIIPIEKGILHWGQVRELGDIVAGYMPGRRTPEEITLFKSNGLAIEDVAVAVKLYELAKAKGVGMELPI